MGNIIFKKGSFGSNIVGFMLVFLYKFLWYYGGI